MVGCCMNDCRGKGNITIDVKPFMRIPDHEITNEKYDIKFKVVHMRQDLEFC